MTPTLNAGEVEQLEYAFFFSSDPEAAVLLVILKSGLRVSDVLALTRAETKKASAKRPAYETAAWSVLRRRWGHGKSCAETVCPGGQRGAQAGYCAYQRCRRYLQRIGKQLGIKHLSLQRLRRTVTQELLREGVAPAEVQKRLGFESLRGVQYHQQKRRKQKKQRQKRKRAEKRN